MQGLWNQSSLRVKNRVADISEQPHSSDTDTALWSSGGGRIWILGLSFPDASGSSPAKSTRTHSVFSSQLDSGFHPAATSTTAEPARPLRLQLQLQPGPDRERAAAAAAALGR